jgi:poly(hydroxyalkanoate) depolymerase family esterase
MVQNVRQQQQDHHQSRLRRLMSAPTIEAIAQTVEEVGKEHASSTGQEPKTDHNAQAAIGTWSSTFERRCVACSSASNGWARDSIYREKTSLFRSQPPTLSRQADSSLPSPTATMPEPRAYKLYVPNANKGQPLPLIVMLHGSTQSTDDFAAGTRMNTVSEECTFLVGYPEQPAAANASKGWNWFRPGDQQRGHGEPSLIAGITRMVTHDYSVDAERIYIAGLSAGGAAAVVMGKAYPDLYAAVGVHSGLPCGIASDLPSAFAAMCQGTADLSMAEGSGPIVPTIVFHGDQDIVVHPRNGDNVIAHSKMTASLNSKVHSGEAPGGLAYTRTVHNDAQGRAILEQWDIHGAGHAWSEGRMQAARWFAFSSTIDVLRTLERAITSRVISPSPA